MKRKTEKTVQTYKKQIAAQQRREEKELREFHGQYEKYARTEHYEGLQNYLDGNINTDRLIDELMFG